jgi:hypothetical protein
MHTMENDDWVVDDDGMHAKMRSGSFEIEASRLAEMTSLQQGEFLHWPIHVASETRFDIERFLDAYRFALAQHRDRYTPEIAPDMLDQSADLARNIWGERPICG